MINNLHTGKADGFRNQYLFVLPDTVLAKTQDNKLFSFLSVTDIGYFPNAENHYRIREQGCDSAILMYCHSGSGFVENQNSERFQVNEGDVIFIPPGTPHCYGASSHNPWSVYWMHFSGLCIPPYAQLIGEKPIHSIDAASTETIPRLFHDCFDILKTPWQIEEYFLLCQTAGTILAHISSGIKKRSFNLSPKGELAIGKCIMFMNRNLHKNITLNEFADYSGFSSSHLNALFKNYTGLSPVNYFLNMKIQASSKEIFFTRRPIKDIALDFGIYDPYYFSRLFKKYMGVSPAKYRETAKG